MNLRYLPLLLLATGACQRASYSFRPPPVVATLAAATRPPAPADSAHWPAPWRRAPAASEVPAARHHWPRQVARAAAAATSALPAAHAPKPTGRLTVVAARAVAARQPAISEDAVFFGLLVAVGVLLLGGGLYLLLGVGGGLAVAGGLLLLLLGLLVALFSVFAAGFKGHD